MIRSLGLFILSLMMLSCSQPESSTVPDTTNTKGPAQRKMLQQVDSPVTVVDQLQALGYMGGYETADDQSGVTQFSEKQVSPGLNLVVSGHGPEVYLMDNHGTVKHQWNCARSTVFPNTQRTDSDKKARSFRRALLLPDRDLLGIYNGTGMVRLDRESNIIWSQIDMCHHDLCLSADKTEIYTIVQELRLFEPLNPHEKVMDENIAVLDVKTGKVKRRISLLNAFHNSRYAPFLKRIPRTGDVLHANTVNLITSAQENISPLYHAGHLIISMRNMDAIAILDPETGLITWALTGMWHVQHEPTILENGNILLFDNAGYNGLSRIIEFNPLSQEIIWQYSGTTEHPLNSSTSGSCSRLVGGNTLIVESNRGRAIEVTHSGQIVWEYINPNRWGPDKTMRATLFDIQRVGNAGRLSTL